MAEENKLSVRDAYLMFMKLAIEGETLTWNRFYIFLVFQSILVVSWVTLLASSKPTEIPSGVYWLLAILGVISGGVWATLGHRGRKMREHYNDSAAAIEKDMSAWVAESFKDPEKKDALKFATPAVECARTSREFGFSFVASRSIMIAGPLLMAVLHVLLLGYAMGWTFR